MAISWKETWEEKGMPPTEGVTQAQSADHLPKFDLGGRGDASFADIEIVEREGKKYLHKRPRFVVTDQAKHGFNYLTARLHQHPFLQERFPHTIMVDDPDGTTYFEQEMLLTVPSHTNMTRAPKWEGDLTQQAFFDPEQIRSPEDLQDILKLAGESLDLFNQSIGDPDSGLDPDLGWMIETTHPDTYILGRRQEDPVEQSELGHQNGSIELDLQEGSEYKVHWIDCHPIIPSTIQAASDGAFNFYTEVDEIARARFGIRLVDLLRESGRRTSLPFSLQQMSRLCISHSS